MGFPEGRFIELVFSCMRIALRIWTSGRFTLFLLCLISQTGCLDNPSINVSRSDSSAGNTEVGDDAEYAPPSTPISVPQCDPGANVFGTIYFSGTAVAQTLSSSYQLYIKNLYSKKYFNKISRPIAMDLNEIIKFASFMSIKLT